MGIGALHKHRLMTHGKISVLDVTGGWGARYGENNLTNKCWRNCGMVGDHTLGLLQNTNILERHQERIGEHFKQ